jgi:hypothetical protein
MADLRGIGEIEGEAGALVDATEPSKGAAFAELIVIVG